MIPIEKKSALLNTKYFLTDNTKKFTNKKTNYNPIRERVKWLDVSIKKYASIEKMTWQILRFGHFIAEPYF